jgi:hypothetical protein
MEDGQISKKILANNPKRKRNVGCPQLRWWDQDTLQEDGTDHVWSNPRIKRRSSR